MAGTVAGTTYGVAKDAKVVGVRVLTCDGWGFFSWVIAGVDWVTGNAEMPAVANMSLGGGPYEPLDDAVAASIASGISYAVAAGNEWGWNACESSPARVTEALTVGSTTDSDARSDFSNVGPCVKLFAPGSDITSAWHTSNTATNTIGGTSMAAPHVAGAAALYLESKPSASSNEVRNAILGTATPGRIADAGEGSPNLLLYSPLEAVESGAVIELQPAAIAFHAFEPPSAAPLSLAGPMRDRTSLEVRSGGQGAGKTGGSVEALTAQVGAAAGQPRTVGLSNLGDQSLSWSAVTDQGWLDVNPASGSLAACASTELSVTVDPSGLGHGTYHGALTVTDPAALNSPRTVPVTLSVLTLIELESGVPVADLSGAEGSHQYFRIHVPDETGRLVVETFGGTGDVDLYVRHGSLPTLVEWDCRPFFWGNHEYCEFFSPAPGDWYVMIHGFDEFEGAALMATLLEATPFINLWPMHLWFHQLSDPTTGTLIAAGQPVWKPTNEQLRAGRTFEGGKS